MTGYSNVLEIIDLENSHLNTRTQSLKNSIGLGPPDLCYVIREHHPSGLKKLVAKAFIRSYYHYIYGVNTSSLASIAAYFRKFVDSIERDKSVKVIFGCFCVYDCFSKLDVRVEIQIPGHSLSYLINPSGQRFHTEEVYWEGAYLSSVLRTLHPTRGTAVALTSFFNNIKEIENFMEIANKFWNKLGFVLEDSDDIKKYGINLLYPSISKYLIKKQRFKLHQQLFKKYLEKDPLMLTFLGKSSMKIRRLEEIVRLISNQLKITPHAFPLYYTLAKAHEKLQDIPEAIKACQYLIELGLEVYNYWHTLVKCYIQIKDYSNAILCFNAMPHYKIEQIEMDLEVEENRILIPEKISFGAAGNIWITPKELDFRPFEDQISSPNSKEKALISKLNGLPGTRLSGSMVKAYKLLVKIEKQIEWQNLLKLKQSLLKKASLSEEEQKIHIQNLSSMGNSTDFNKNGFTGKLNPTTSHDFQVEIDE
jgi:Chs5-Arf1p-binding protein BUD7/BCH1